MRFGELLDHVGHLAPTPVFHTVNNAAAAGDDALVALDHRRDLLALVRMDDKYDFVMTHANSFWTDSKIAHPGVKTGVGRGKPAIIPLKRGQLNALGIPRQALSVKSRFSRLHTCFYNATV